jgi:hypothetical protein
MLPAPAHYVPYHEIGDQPHIVVDGKEQESTVLTLSHWPWNRTPKHLQRDTSTGIAFAYLDDPASYSSAPIVTNSHYDEDGLLAMFALINPEMACEHRELMLDTSLAGDFAQYSLPEAAKLSFVLAAYSDPDVSPLPDEVFAGSLRQQIVALYSSMLEQLPVLLGDIPGNRQYWEDEYQHLLASEEMLSSGLVTIDEHPDIDLMVVRIPADIPPRLVRRYLKQWQRPVHPFAVFNRSPCTRVLWVHGDAMELQFRYESWLQIVSRRPLPRVDLSGLAQQLNTLDTVAGEWEFEGVHQIAARLWKGDGCGSSVQVDTMIALLTTSFANEPAAWDPYGPPPRG